MFRSIAPLALATALCACAHSYNVSIPATDGSTVALNPGESASLATGRVRYVRLVSDSRCPPGVQCVWAGDATIELEWTPTSGPARMIILHVNPQAGDNTANLGGRRIGFTWLERVGARASLRIDRAD